MFGLLVVSILGLICEYCNTWECYFLFFGRKNKFIDSNFFFLEEKINLLIQTYNRSIEPTYKLLKTINDLTIFRLVV